MSDEERIKVPYHLKGVGLIYLLLTKEQERMMFPSFDLEDNLAVGLKKLDAPSGVSVQLGLSK